MRRLHLIKPWHLHAVRQGIKDREQEGWVPANAPDAAGEVTIRRNDNFGFAHYNPVPGAGIIFIPQTAVR